MTIKQKLIEQITTIKDQNTLKFLGEMLHQVNDEGLFELPDKMKQDIKKSISQIEMGEFETHEQVIKRLLYSKPN